MKQNFVYSRYPMFFKGIEEDSEIQVHGLLGTDFLINNKWIIDFKELNIHS